MPRKRRDLYDLRQFIVRDLVDTIFMEKTHPELNRHRVFDHMKSNISSDARSKMIEYLIRAKSRVYKKK